MIQVIDRSNAHLYVDVLKSFAELRYEVFIKRCGWDNIAGSEGYEQDQFDDENAVYLICRNLRGQVVGGARLLDTSRRCLLNHTFPYLVNGPVPEDRRVFEVTRFVVDPRKERLEGCGNVCEELLWALQEYGAWAGLTHLVSVSYLSLEPILRRAGYRSRRMGNVFKIDGLDVAALQHDVDAATRQHSRHRVKTTPIFNLPVVATNPFDHHPMLGLLAEV
jgi:acyl homoserine lactone synthase